MKIKTLLFDVHRTLVDDSGFPREFIWKFIQSADVTVQYAEYEQRYAELVKHLFNWPAINPFIPIREIHRRKLVLLYREFGIMRDIEPDLNFLWMQMRKSQVYPEVPYVLAEVQKDYDCALVSNADNDDPLLHILEKTGYKFATVVTSEMVKSYKPDPKIFFHALSKLRCKPHEAVVIGDSPLSDILGARNAGIKMIWLNRANQVLPPAFPTPDFEIQNLTQLLPALKQLNYLKN